ncbi:probable G-protein coupled receptor Mth-like 1 isoform X2 [Palaemon carinicauda]
MKISQLWFTLLILLWAGWTHGSPEQTLVVSKCCPENEYFDSVMKKCEVTTGSNYADRVRTLLTDASTNITYKTGNLTQCPIYNHTVEIQVTPQNHAIMANGRLHEKWSGVVYHQANYCMEFKASSPEELGGTLIARVCPMMRNCCYINQDHDAFSSECQESFGNISNYNERINSFLDTDQESSILPNESSKSLKIIRLDKTYSYIMSGTVLLCDSSYYCHPTSACCKVDFGDGRGAFICQNAFKKCCPSNEIWTDNGCLSKQMHQPSSSRMANLMKSYFPQNSLPTLFDEPCRTIFKSADEHIQWYIEGSLILSVHANEGKESIFEYCIEDYEDDTGALDSMAMLCLRDIAPILSREILNKYDKGLSIGKCCHIDKHFNKSLSCISDTYHSNNILEQPAFVAANITELSYTGFPKCKNRGGNYISYVYGKKEGKDYAILLEDQTMGVVVIDEESGCNFTIGKLRNADYCIETYSLTESTSIQIYICDDLYSSSLKHQEKYIVVPVLMIISISALMYTVYFLFSMRVRRGLFTVKKVNTLAGRILLSYVISYLMTFLLLSIGMIAPIRTSTVACPLLAGSIMFFMLAAFLWNTSVCVESLLLTLDVRVSEQWRLLWHCLWAWGIPGLITAVALTLDHYRADLECSIVTPKVGLNRCFFSDEKAQLLYLYTPMCISLGANIILLIASNLIRKATLRKIERGMQHISSNQDEKKIDGNRHGNDNVQRPNARPTLRQHSGLRKIENRNVWVDSAKLVFWAGSTWILEVVAFLITYNRGKWYDYLWYLPVSINALRGVGIFIIIVLTPDVRKKISKRISINCPWFAKLTKKSHTHSKGVTSQTIPRDTSDERSSMTYEPETTVTRL